MITFAGMIGAGKTTYTTTLANDLGLKPFLEEVDDNPIIKAYYEEPERYAFPMQIHFLTKRFEAVRKALDQEQSIVDRSMYEDALFAHRHVKAGNISSAENSVYLELLMTVEKELSRVNTQQKRLMVYLDASYEHILANIKKRGRSYEQIDGKPELETYYRELYQDYQEWIQSYDKSPLLVIDVDHYDIQENPNDYDEVKQMIFNRYEEI